MKKKSFLTFVIVSMVTLSTALGSCTSRTPVNTPQEETAADTVDSTLVATAESNIQAHQEDIQALWELSFGEEKKIASYYLAGDHVYLSSEDGNDGLLLSFYKDIKDIDNFDGVPVSEGQEMSFQGDALIIRDKDKATYYEKTEYEGYNERFTVTEKDGKKTYTNDFGEPFDEKDAQAFIDKISKETVTKLSDILTKWK